jgi:hypothetical protein
MQSSFNFYFTSIIFIRRKCLLHQPFKGIHFYKFIDQTLIEYILQLCNHLETVKTGCHYPQLVLKCE